MLVALMLTAVQVMPVQAEGEVEEYTPAEQYVLTQLLANGEADLAKGFENINDRVISGAFITGLFENPDLQDVSFIRIYNATIEGDIKGDGMTVPFNLVFDKCTFLGRIEFSRATIRSFNMYDSTVAGSVRLGRAIIEEDLALYNSTYESAVILFGADIGGNFYAYNSKFNGTQPDADTAYPFELWLAHVAKTTQLGNAVIKGKAMFEGGRFDGNLVLNNTTFEDSANFKDVRVGNFLDAGQVVFKDQVTFESGIVDRDANFAKAAFHGTANFNYFSTQRFVDFDESVFDQEVSFLYAETGWPDFQKTTFNSLVNFTGMRVSNDLNFNDAVYTFGDEPFSITLAEVEGAVLMDNFTSATGISLLDNQFGDLEISGQKEIFAVIDLTATQVGGSLSVTNLVTEEFHATEFTAGDSTTFQNFIVRKNLDIGNASLGFFDMNQFAWPADPASFNLRGMEYADIGLGDLELTDANWRILLNMLEESVYSPEAYRTLSQFLMDKGFPDWAAEVELTRKVRERDQILTPLSAPWFWSWFLYLFSGYGQMPVLAFVWSLLVIAIGAIVFRKEELMDVVDDEVVMPIYHPILYSFDLFLPYIELGIADKWDPKPERRGAWMYKHVHQLLGWILMPIALLTFGGIIG